MIFAIYGFLLVWGHLAIIALDPASVVQYFGIFLNYAPPLLLIIAAAIINLDLMYGSNCSNNDGSSAVILFNNGKHTFHI